MQRLKDLILSNHYSSYINAKDGLRGSNIAELVAEDVFKEENLLDNKIKLLESAPAYSNDLNDEATLDPDRIGLVE